MGSNHHPSVVCKALLLAAAIFVLPLAAGASQTTGTIDTVHKYAWGNNIGWVNFGATSGSVQVTDTNLTGYAWSQNFGWINLGPAQSGVKNDGSGNLSGQAWGEHIGWINFSGVTINTSGVFSGTATTTSMGSISFSCTNCSVITDWRPSSVRSTSTASSGGGGGGNAGGPPAAALVPPHAPPGGFRILINGGAAATADPHATVTSNALDDVKKMALSPSPSFWGAGQQPYAAQTGWNICFPAVSCPYGVYAVYAIFYTSWGQPSGVVSSSIVYAPLPAVAPGVVTTTPSQQPPTGVLGTIQSIIRSVPDFLKTVPQQLFSRLPEYLQKLLPGFLQPPSVALPAPPPPRIPQLPPLAFLGKWELLPRQPLAIFVLTPLPRDIANLTQKFPGLARTFLQIGISRQADVPKLRSVSLNLPTLPAAVGLSPVELAPGKFSLPPGVPVAELSVEFKQKIPQEVVFARSWGEKLDLNVNLRLSQAGELEPHVEAVAGMPLHLVVRPERAPQRVRGYLVFKTRNRTNEQLGYRVPYTSLLGSLIFSAPPEIARPASANRFLALEGANMASISNIAYRNLLATTKPNVETRLALLEFDYHDEGDGIYVADIQAPVVDGTYEVVTRIDYGGAAAESKEIRLLAVVDPEGYVYEENGGRQTRIPGAVISLYWLNPDTKQYIVWPAGQYNQENPQVTDARGTYAFLVPDGYYYTAVDAPGYDAYQSKPFEVVKGSSGIHMNIELKNRYWYLHILDWKTTLLVMVAFLLLYNFYQDRRRGKTLRPQGIPLPPRL